MKQYRILTMTLTMTVLFTLIWSALALGSVDDLCRFSTKHGDLTFVDEKGQLSRDAVEIRLNGKTLMKSIPIEEHWNDGSLHYWNQTLAVAFDRVHTPFGSIQKSPKYKPGDRPIRIERILVAEDYRGRTTQFIILDFTGKEPFVSERFGCNPEYKYNLGLERVKWGKMKAIISLLSYDCTYDYANKRVECDELVSE